MRLAAGLRSASLPLALAAALAAVLAASQSVLLLHEGESALVLRDGRALRLDNADGHAPGLYLKWPAVEEAVRLDRRLQVLPASPQAVAATDGVRLRVSATVLYRIADPWRFHRAGDGSALTPLAGTAVREVASTRPAAALSGDGRTAASAALLAALRRSASAADLGVEIAAADILDVRPDADADATRTRDAAELAAVQVRADGEANRREALAAAERDAAALRDEGERRALEVRGEGDGQRTAILADAYGRDPEFARFLRRLEAYDQALDPATTTMVLSSGNSFLDLFEHGPGAQGAARR